MEMLSETWGAITANPVPFLCLAAALLGAGWATGRFLFTERLESVKGRLEAREDDLGRANQQIAGLTANLSQLNDELRVAQEKIESRERDRVDDKVLAASSSGHKPVEKDVSDGVTFPYMSPNGVNILCPAVDSVRVGEVVGVRAVIPKGRTLLLKMEGLGPQQATAAWSWKLTGTTLGWDHENYNLESSVPMQTWTAAEGLADLKFTFHRAGEVELRLATDDGKTDAVKTLRVKP